MSIVSAAEGSKAGRNFWLGVAAYLVPTFPLGFFWHLAWFEDRYRTLAIYRADPIISLGLASMAVQALIFSWAYPRLFPVYRGSTLKAGLLYGLVMGLLSWSFTTLAVAAKHPVGSIVDYMMLETGFTFVQFLIVGPLMALAHRN
ncbi:hypothetical protein ACFFWD_33075 [Bradyrhizobium erythrophlei]|uniref:hypothetical protein n=1 Tax=Bradyrhizobium erythrophlei TaxID=1437360 RepID=UPI0035EF2CDB